jgi:hypothetical protein
MKVKKFNELSEGFFSLKERIFDPIRFKKMAKIYFDICKGDGELLRLVGDFIDEYPLYSSNLALQLEHGLINQRDY